MYFLHFVQAFMTQVTNTALANGKAKIEERVARWLLMVHDRTEGNELGLTHEFIAMMLGVRRAGVTTALQHLVKLNLIEVKRSHILVRRTCGPSEYRGRHLRIAGARVSAPHWLEAAAQRLTGDGVQTGGARDAGLSR